MAGGLHSVVVILELYYEHLHYPEKGIWLRIRKFLINIIEVSSTKKAKSNFQH